MEKNTVIGEEDPDLSVRVRRKTPLMYDDDPDPNVERPPHVRAASSLVYLVNRLALVQDDANFLALIDPDDHRAESVTLPAGPKGQRVHDHDDGSGEYKLDLEACAAVPESDGKLMLAFGSGSNENREWVVTIDWRNDDGPETELFEAHAMYDAWRTEKAFCGAGLNVEGAVFLDAQRLRLFQRGNASPDGVLQPVDATADVLYSELVAHIEDPANIAPPVLENIVRYEIGSLDGVRLTFSDADNFPGGMLFSASAEGEDRIAGSVLGIIDENGARWAKITDQDGSTFRGKVEGLTLSPTQRNLVYFVIDDDDAARPSDLYEVELEGDWCI